MHQQQQQQSLRTPQHPQHRGGAHVAFSTPQVPMGRRTHAAPPGITAAPFGSHHPPVPQPQHHPPPQQQQQQQHQQQPQQTYAPPPGVGRRLSAESAPRYVSGPSGGAHQQQPPAPSQYAQGPPNPAYPSAPFGQGSYRSMAAQHAPVQQKQAAQQQMRRVNSFDAADGRPKGDDRARAKVSEDDSYDSSDEDDQKEGESDEEQSGGDEDDDDDNDDDAQEHDEPPLGSHERVHRVSDGDEVVEPSERAHGSEAEQERRRQDTNGLQHLRALCLRWAPLKQSMQQLTDSIKALRATRAGLRKRVLRLMVHNKIREAYVCIQATQEYVVLSVETARASASLSPKLINAALRNHARDLVGACIRARAAPPRTRRPRWTLSDDEDDDDNQGKGEVGQHDEGEPSGRNHRDDGDAKGPQAERKRVPGVILVDSPPTERGDGPRKRRAPDEDDSSISAVDDKSEPNTDDDDGDDTSDGDDDDDDGDEDGRYTKRAKRTLLLHDILCDLVVSAARAAQRQSAQGRKRLAMAIHPPSFRHQLQPLVISLDMSDQGPLGDADMASALDAFLRGADTPDNAAMASLLDTLSSGGSGADGAGSPQTRIKPLPKVIEPYAIRLYDVEKKIGKYREQMRPLRQQIDAMTVDLPPEPLPAETAPAATRTKGKRALAAQQAAQRAAEARQRHASYQATRSIVARYVAAHSPPPLSSSSSQTAEAGAPGAEARVTGIAVRLPGSPHLYRLRTAVRNHAPNVNRAMYPSLIRDAAATVLRAKSIDPGRTTLDEGQLYGLLQNTAFRHQLVKTIQATVQQYRQTHTRQSHRLVLAKVSGPSSSSSS